MISGDQVGDSAGNLLEMKPKINFHENLYKSPTPFTDIMKDNTSVPVKQKYLRGRDSNTSSVSTLGIMNPNLLEYYPTTEMSKVKKFMSVDDERNKNAMSYSMSSIDYDQNCSEAAVRVNEDLLMVQDDTSLGVKKH